MSETINPDSLPTLYHQSKEGKIQTWFIWTKGSVIWTEFGTQDGKKQLAQKEAKVKNKGRSNETLPEEQAKKQAKSMWQAKLDRKYRLTIEEAKKPLPLPMLAKKFEGREDKVSYPCHVQPKLDGLRVLCQWNNGKVELTSRSGKTYKCSSLVKVLEKELPPDVILDGEIYIHGTSLQQINRLVKKERKESSQLKIYVYDFIYLLDIEAIQTTRTSNLKDFFRRVESDKLVHVKSVLARDEADVISSERDFVAKGFEGAIVRLLNGKYRWGYRSSSLLKVKSFQDEDFKVISWTRGEGKYINVPVWKCEMSDGQTFDVVSKGTMKYRAELLKKADSYIGRILKVKFFDRTEAGIPTFGVGLSFRLEEDIEV